MKGDTYHLPRESFSLLLDSLAKRDYIVYGPTVKEGVIVLAEIKKEEDLPIGWQDEQKPGSYRLLPREDKALFGYNLGPHSWKKYLFPPKEKLYTIQKQANGLSIMQQRAEREKKAFLAVRACEIEAIHIQDTVFTEQAHTYDQYKERRENTFIIAISCTRHVSTCFCTTMGSGPLVDRGYDIALTEVIESDDHYFIFEIGSEKGRDIASLLPLQRAEKKQVELAKALVENNALAMEKEFDDKTVPSMLKKSWHYKQWSDVAQRCVSCGNCTMACPTCFCTKREEKLSIDGGSSEGLQLWESCFNHSHSYIHGGSVRTSTLSKYRQWLTHKFGTWWDQFGLSGCVGCGRCITWCPVGIDVRSELVALQKEEQNENNT